MVVSILSHGLITWMASGYSIPIFWNPSLMVSSIVQGLYQKPLKLLDDHASLALGGFTVILPMLEMCFVSFLSIVVQGR